MSTSQKPELSLIVPVRGRAEHLSVLLAWLARERLLNGSSHWDLLLVEGAPVPRAAQATQGLDWARHIFVPQHGPFCKSQLLNRGAQLARGEFVASLDVDLLPAAGVLGRQLELARNCRACVVSGYRVMLHRQPRADALPDPRELAAEAWSNGTNSLGPEEQPSATLKYLLKHDRFGICPFFPREQLLAVGAWDEQYVGWGAEDQDILHRLAPTLTTVRAHDLLYFHMPHGPDPDWHVAELTAANRKRFFLKRNESNV